MAKMPKVKKCDMSECSYNKDVACHAMAITVDEHPLCDTFYKNPSKGGAIDTVAETIYRWCPPSGPGGENKQATEGYIAFVCAVLGCNRDDEFDFNDPNFLYWMATAIGEQECGHDAFLSAVSEAELREAVRLAIET